MNAQTFYMSNMTPQLNRLNQDMWAKLETKVRANNCSDTLYVVTGAYFGAGATTNYRWSKEYSSGSYKLLQSTSAYEEVAKQERTSKTVRTVN